MDEDRLFNLITELKDITEDVGADTMYASLCEPDGKEVFTVAAASGDNSKLLANFMKEMKEKNVDNGAKTIISTGVIERTTNNNDNCFRRWHKP